MWRKFQLPLSSLLLSLKPNKLLPLCSNIPSLKPGATPAPTQQIAIGLGGELVSPSKANKASAARVSMDGTMLNEASAEGW